jgi:hypothetical protein
MTERYFILLYNKIDMKIKMPRLSRGVNHQILMVLILLVVVVFITAMPWASNIFHEALENISEGENSKISQGENLKEEVQQTKTEEEKEKTQEGFISNSLLFKESPTMFPGAPIDTTNWNSYTNIGEDIATPVDRNSLYMFNNARFSPNCCAKGPGSGMSTSMGCVCLTNSDAFYITQGRGGGNINPTNIF